MGFVSFGGFEEVHHVLRPSGFRDVGDVGGTYGEEAETDCSYELAGGHGGRHVCGLWCGVVMEWVCGANACLDSGTGYRNYHVSAELGW